MPDPISSTNSADLGRERSETLSVAVALVAGITAGFFVLPYDTTVTHRIFALVPVGFGALAVIAIRRGEQVTSWVSLILVARFLLDIAKGPHVPEISALCLGTGVAAFVATLRNHQRFAQMWTVAYSVFWGATMIGGLFLAKSADPSSGSP